MNRVRIASFTCLAACMVSPVFAQYGLYGSPDVMRLPQQQTVQQQYAAPSAYPATAAQPAQQTAPTYYAAQPQYGYQASPQYNYQAQQQQPQYGYQVQPQYGYAPAQQQYNYPGQPQAATTYQPYQSGSQYRYPSPSMRAPVRMAAVQQPAPQQIPTPPASPAGVPPYDAPAALAPVPQNNNMMNQMLTDSNCNGGNNGCGVYSGAVNRFEQAACGGNEMGCAEDFYRPWYASVSALVMSRSNGHRLWTSYETNNLPNQIMNSDFSMSWKWGGEVRLGRRFCCGCTQYALEGSYWTTESFTGSQYAEVSGGSVSTTLNVNDMRFGSSGAIGWFTSSEAQTLTRRDEFHNFELNLIREQMAWSGDSPWDIGWSVGLRYFRFQDALMFRSLHDGGEWDDPTAVATLGDTISNNLIGAQFGFDAAYNVWNNIRLFITPKVGIYNNYIESNFRARLDDGTIARSTYYGSFANAHGTKNVFSFLTQVDVGADWQFTRNWSARAGYRLVAVTNVGLADEQFPQYITDIPEIQAVQSSESLILHGAFFGVTYNF